MSGFCFIQEICRIPDEKLVVRARVTGVATKNGKPVSTGKYCRYNWDLNRIQKYKYYTSPMSKNKLTRRQFVSTITAGAGTVLLGKAALAFTISCFRIFV